jgi:hypothetical protein
MGYKPSLGEDKDLHGPDMLERVTQVDGEGDGQTGEIL